MANLLQIGTSGVLGHQQMLNTTGNNISNVNTEGYSRQRTLHNSQTDNMGLARSDTGREINQFAQAEVLLDTSKFNNRDKFLTEITRTDQVLSDSSNNLGSGVSTLFESFHTLNDDPTSLSTRELALSDAKSLVISFRSVGKQLQSQMKTANDEITAKPDLLNALIKEIHGLNQQVMISNNTSQGVSGTLLDKRDESIKALASEVDISTIVNDNKSISINLISGQPLVMQSSVSQFTTVTNNPQTSINELVLNIDNNQISLQETELGGTVGALFTFRDDVVYPALREIGQLALGIGSAINSQNRMGLDLNGQLGNDIYGMPETMAQGYHDNSNSEHMITATIRPTEGGSLTVSQYQITMTSPLTFDVYEIKDGQKSTNPLPISGAYPGPVTVDEHGFDIDFSAAAGGFKSGDKFILSPTLFNFDDYQVTASRPEDIALSSALRSSRNTNNITDSQLIVSSIFDSSLSFSNNALSMAAPQRVTVNNNGDFDIFDANGTLLATTPSTLLGADLLANSVPPLNPQTGYEIKISGNPNPGESFSLHYNSNSAGDNANGLKLAGLESENTLRQNKVSGGGNQMTISEGISTLISGIGNKTRAARVDQSASESKLTQSQNWVESVSGINLDEEAANMVRYEQAYNASARVVTISKEIFDTILNAAR